MANLGKILLQRKYINLIQLNLALDFQVFYGNRLGTNLLELGIVTEKQLCEALSEIMGLPYVTREQLEDVPRHILERLPRETAYRCRAIPFKLVGQKLHVVMENTADKAAVAQIKRECGEAVVLYIAPELTMSAYLQKHYGIPMEPRLQGLWMKQAMGQSKGLGAIAVATAEEQTATPPPDRWINDEEDRSFRGLEERDKDGKKITLSVQKISLMLDEAKTRDEISALILQFALKYLRRAALFVIRKDFVFGWDGSGEGLKTSHVKSIVIPIEEPSIFRTLVTSQGHILGDLPRNPINDQFVLALGGKKKPKNILVLPLTVGGITFGALYGDNLDKEVESSSINELQVMVSRANIAFQRLIIVERQKAMSHHAAL